MPAQKWLAIALALTALPCVAQIYRWTDAQGQVHFGDQPSRDARAQVVTPHINTYSGVEVTTGPDSPADAAPAARHHSVLMYSASWCGVCRKARAYFTAQHIPFTEYDVEQSAKGRRDFAALHGSGVPIILVGHRRMNGFDATAFDAMYSGAD